MSEKFELPEELSSFEQKLAGLKVPPADLDRDEILFQAGYAAAMAELNSAELKSTAPTKQPAALATSRSSHSAAWPISTAIFASLSALLAVLLFWPNLFPHDNPSPIAGTDSVIAQNDPAAPAAALASSLPDRSIADDSNKVDLAARTERAKQARRSRFSNPAVWAPHQSPVLMSRRAGEYNWSAIRQLASSESKPQRPLSVRALLLDQLHDIGMGDGMGRKPNRNKKALNGESL